jgi:hypothetical protein
MGTSSQSENICRYHHAVADGALDGETTTVNLRLDIFNDHSSGERGLNGTAFPARHF